MKNWNWWVLSLISTCTDYYFNLTIVLHAEVNKDNRIYQYWKNYCTQTKSQLYIYNSHPISVGLSLKSSIISIKPVYNFEDDIISFIRNGDLNFYEIPNVI